MGSEKKLDHDHADHVPRNHTLPKLSLLVSRTNMPLLEAPTPPPKCTASIPFEWEEAPGKPRPCHTRSEPKGSDVVRTLELPPRLLFSETTKASNNNMHSPTTVLDGPYYAGRAMSFTSSYRTPKDTCDNANFGSSRWSGLKKNKSEDSEGSFDFSSWTEDDSKVKITRARRKGSFLNISQARSHLWASIYERLKLVVPAAKRRQEKQKKEKD